MSTYTMYCLRYVLDSCDHAVIMRLEQGSRILEIRDLAKEYLTQLAVTNASIGTDLSDSR